MLDDDDVGRRGVADGVFWFEEVDDEFLVGRREPHSGDVGVREHRPIRIADIAVSGNNGESGCSCRWLATGDCHRFLHAVLASLVVIFLVDVVVALGCNGGSGCSWWRRRRRSALGMRWRRGVGRGPGERGGGGGVAASALGRFLRRRVWNNGMVAARGGGERRRVHGSRHGHAGRLVVVVVLHLHGRRREEAAAGDGGKMILLVGVPWIGFEEGGWLRLP